MDQLGDLERLQNLREKGALTEEEFQNQKRLLLAAGSSELASEPSASDLWPGQEEFENEDDHLARRPMVIVAILISLLLGTFLAWKIYSASDSSESVRVVVTGPANARTLPTINTSEVIEELDAGLELQGRWVPSQEDPETMWLEYESNGRVSYVWSGNLEELQAANEDKPDLEVELVQNLTSNAPDFRIEQEVGSDLLGLPSTQTYVLNAGKPEVINYININGRSEPACTIWPIYGYDVFEYRFYPTRENPYEVKDGAETDFMFIGHPSDDALKYGIESPPGEFSLSLNVGDRARLKIPRSCGRLVTLDFATNYGSYQIRMR